MYWRKVLKWIANLITPIDTCGELSQWEYKNKLLRLTQLRIGKYVAIGPGFQCITGNENTLIIDDYVSLGHNVKIYNFNLIKIGSFCTIAADVSITNGGHDINTLEPFSGPLSIGRGCWIGQGARLVGAISIGDNVIIGAGAVVIKDVPAGAIVAGIPAKIIKMRELPEKVWYLGNIYFNPQTFQTINTR